MQVEGSLLIVDRGRSGGVRDHSPSERRFSVGCDDIDGSLRGCWRF